jgi:hypothetical protein
MFGGPNLFCLLLAPARAGFIPSVVCVFWSEEPHLFYGLAGLQEEIGVFASPQIILFLLVHPCPQISYGGSDLDLCAFGTPGKPGGDENWQY